MVRTLIGNCLKQDTCAGRFLLVLLGSRAEGQVCADPGPPSNQQKCFSHFTFVINWGCIIHMQILIRDLT